MTSDVTAACPLPIGQYTHVLMAHGGGGRLMQQLIDQVFISAFSNPRLDERHDGAILDAQGRRFAFTTDSYVVRPLFFPGGDIGTLAVNGTVNDLAMCGARPRWLSAGFILEEGLPIETLERIVASMRQAAATAGVEIVTGDTKVVEKGKGDSLFVNTAGLGTIDHSMPIGPRHARIGDAILLNGDLGRHGMAIQSVRDGLEFEGPIESDCAPLADIVMGLIEAGIAVHCLRDLTRGGLAAGLNEIAATARIQIDIDESAVPVSEPVRGACEILGFDPLYVANEGRMIAFVPESDADRALAIMRALPVGDGACRIGSVLSDSPGLVTLKSRIGARRILDLLSGEQLPRIC
ncbi:MAG: hydrogenase expression/formation protein HypE [Verrucomicrobia bacterium]|jgi:hydrogenase expression/formation protein HypE|nr:hydrogenase expression/formation protein HypE [Verrucomicrobiota bacterium]OQC63207.1 MAG: Hydrogenase expression/formation protein HypE [Verrucomicrobia bacterium ADurb.Bin006]MDI9380096.1 hydrogenase expression/formation protein HypE [Verrucomicrobiota bacterium]NMD19321.1 hydrogenase expression/formation protein HypE [Verrucomicrobiota bacterium]HNU99876.1 hydrogenase expression/formation protein HypE [Verrucomicrobiota bacterium]